MDQLDIPHLDQYGKRVYWVWVAEFKEDNILDGPAELVPYYGPALYRGHETIKEPFPADKERFRIGQYLCEKPYFKVHGYFMQLKPELREWLETHKYSYVFQYRWTLDRFGWYVGLHDTKAAAHFKLVHGG